MCVRIAVLASVFLGFGTACGGDNPEPVDPGVATALEGAADLCNPTTGSGPERDRAIPISSGSRQGRDCDEARARRKALNNFATTYCVDELDPGCPRDCEECSDEEPCQRTMGSDDRLVKSPTRDEDGMTCTVVDDRSCPRNADGERKGFRCTLDTARDDGTSRTFYCGCFCRA
jgi:hypothetical protein